MLDIERIDSRDRCSAQRDGFSERMDISNLIEDIDVGASAI